MLSAEYREFMTPSKYKHLMEIVNATREREILKKQIERGERRALDENPSPTKTQKVNECPKKGNTKGGSTQCKTCGKAHRDECYFKNNSCVTCRKVGYGTSSCLGKVSVCYKCYKLGHKRFECPELVGKKETLDTKTEVPKSKARSFHITAAKAKVKPNVVSSTFIINSIIARILFHTGANRSFVSHRFIRHPTFTLTKLPMPLEVGIGNNKSFIICVMCRDCKLNVDGEDYLVDLIPMLMGEFQVVIGMDWLSRHHAKVICFRKEIQPTSPSGRRVIIFGEKNCNPNMCSMIEAHKLLRHGRKAYLTYIRDSDKESPKIKDVPVV
ncbi:uncharacterized protein LOC110918983 [Helianthus annuus]|uniref:uncharacterized protein LOC110918983 n=1 Tax=Helianthus annuus TaxID=4232 RepID=UPI000B8F978D|nr:uncharacterized protein LOC110918983 [Helianthus annuus]